MAQWQSLPVPSQTAQTGDRQRKREARLPLPFCEILQLASDIAGYPTRCILQLYFMRERWVKNHRLPCEDDLISSIERCSRGAKLSPMYCRRSSQGSWPLIGQWRVAGVRHSSQVGAWARLCGVIHSWSGAGCCNAVIMYGIRGQRRNLHWLLIELQCCAPAILMTQMYLFVIFMRGEDCLCFLELLALCRVVCYLCVCVCVYVCQVMALSTLPLLL